MSAAAVSARGDGNTMYDVVIVGSGYAGSVVAARLAGRGRVLLVERGRWWRPGQFPESLAGVAGSLMTARNPLGLWSMRLGHGTGNAFVSALGGSSVANYGITARPDAHTFESWPVGDADLAPWFARALSVLEPTPNPEADDLGDKQFLDRVVPGAREDIRNTIDWDACTQCGRCVPGCNVGAKRSLDRTYLGLAMDAGVEVRCETEVVAIARRAPAGYDVVLRPTSGHGAATVVPTRRLVLAAGTLGTLDLLHAARGELPVGPLFGRRMSMNGDGMAFLYDTTERLSSHSGAPISTSARLRAVDEEQTRRTLLVMSGRVPAAVMRLAGHVLAAGVGPLAALTSPPDGDTERERDHRGWAARLRRGRRRLRDLGAIGPDGAFARTFMYKLDGQDSSAGTARFVDGRAVIDWPDYLDDPINRFAEGELKRWAREVGGRVIGNIARLPGMRSFSVHPLGGCRMGRDIDDGVVDDAGRVFDPSGGVYPGLRIVDGSIVRSALGVPPSLTITALAERIAADMLTDLEARGETDAPAAN